MTDLERTYNKDNENSLIIYKPLLYYPELKQNDLIKSDFLNISEKEVLIACLDNPKIKTLQITRGSNGSPNSKYYDELVDMIGMAIWVMGITEKSMPKNEQLFFIPIAIDEIKNDYGHLSIEEVKIAFKRGSRRKYGETMQMSIATINIWLSKYIEEDKFDALDKLKYIRPIEIEEKKEPTEQEKLERHKLWLEHIYKSFDEYVLTNNYDYFDFNNNLYKYLKKLSLIKLNEKQQEFIWNKAVAELKEEYHPKNGRNFGNRIELKDIYDILKSEKTDDVNDLIVIRAKRLTVKYFFKKLKKENKHIKDVIDGAEKDFFKKR